MQHSGGSAGRHAKHTAGKKKQIAFPPTPNSPTHTNRSSSAVQPGHGSRATMISSLNIENSKCPKKKGSLEQGCQSTDLKEQFLKSLELIDKIAASKKKKTTQSGDGAGNIVVTNTMSVGRHQQHIQHHVPRVEECADAEEARKLQDIDDISSCESGSTSARKTSLSSGAEQEQEPQRSKPRHPEYLERVPMQRGNYRLAAGPVDPYGKSISTDDAAQAILLHAAQRFSRSQPMSASSAAQLASDSTAAQLASVSQATLASATPPAAVTSTGSTVASSSSGILHIDETSQLQGKVMHAAAVRANHARDSGPRERYGRIGSFLYSPDHFQLRASCVESKYLMNW